MYKKAHTERKQLLFDHPDVHRMDGNAIHGGWFQTDLISPIMQFFGGGELWQGGAYDSYAMQDARAEALREGRLYKQAHGLDLTYFDVVVDVYGGGLAPLMRPDAELIKNPLMDAGLTPSAIETFNDLGKQVALFLAEGKKVLVHCQAGLNRSGLTSALAMRELGIAPREAIRHLRESRCDAVLCNKNFVEYLECLEDGRTYKPKQQTGFAIPLPKGTTSTGWQRVEIEDDEADDVHVGDDDLAMEAAEALWEDYATGELTYEAFKAAMDRLVASNSSLT